MFWSQKHEFLALPTKSDSSTHLGHCDKQTEVNNQDRSGHQAVSKKTFETVIVLPPWNNGKEVPRWGVAEIQKMSPSTTGRCK